MKTIFLITYRGPYGEERYYAGVDSVADAYLIAARNGHDSDQIDVSMIPNRHGIQPDEYKRCR